jgi:serine/threonine protein kinase
MNQDGDIYVCVIMEFYKNSDMQRYFQKQKLEILDEEVNNQNLFNLKTIMDIMFQISSGLSYLHDMKTIHRDIKPGKPPTSHEQYFR